MTEIHLTAENFEKEVLQSEIPVLVDFYAEWCGPCKMLSPVIDEIAKEYEGKAKICRVNVDEEMELAQQYRVMSVPTVLVFKNGQVSGKRSLRRCCKRLCNGIDYRNVFDIM